MIINCKKALSIPIKNAKTVTLFLFIILSITVSAQNQRINISKSTAKVSDILKEIEKQTKLSVDYNHNDLSKISGNQINIQSGTLKDVLDKVLSGTALTYVIDSEHIVIVPVRENVTNSAQREISGMVVDNNDDAVIGATVKQKGTTNGVMADFNGMFKITVPDDAILTISYIGYKTVDVSVAGKKELRIRMQEDSKLLDDVIVIGYGSTSVKKNVASVTALKGEKVQDLPYATVTSALQGRTPGVIIQESGGQPGSSPSISIRGGGKPMYVIDGVMSNSDDDWDFRSLNPNDIESISILKDAASLAVYGSRAADGIVLVKTKEGKKGKTSITYSFNAQYSQPAILPEKIDSYTYASVQNQVAQSEGFGEYYAYDRDEMEAIKNQTDPYRYANTDWLDIGLRNFAPEYKHSLSMTGSQKNINYYMSLGVFDQGSIYESDALTFRRYNLRNNVNTTFEDIGLRVALNVNATMEKKKYPSFSAGEIWDHLFSRTPLQPAFNPDGTLSSISDHPLMEMDKRSGYAKNDGLFLNTQFVADWSVPWVQGLTLGTMLYYRLNSTHVKNFSARAPQYNLDGTVVETSKPSLREEAYFGEGYNFEVNASYFKTFADKHSVDAKFVFTAQEMDGSNFWASRRNYLSTQVDQLFAGASEGMQNSGNSDEGGRLGLVARVKYDYDMRYYVEGSFRYDGNDNFAPGHRWGFFPSVAVAWDITEEPFFKNLNWKNVNLLKLRASYGRMGTDTDVDRFGYLPVYNLVENSINIGGNLQSGFTEGALVSPELMTWYTRNSLNYAVDFSFLNKRLNGTAEYFYYVTKGGLMKPKDRYTTPLGKDLPMIKSDSEHRREGVEMYLRWSDKINGDFTYEVGANMTYYNQLWAKKADESIGTLMNPYQRQTHQTSYWGLMLLDNGFYQTPEQILSAQRPLASSATKMGDIVYQDINGDGKIDGEDKVRYGMPSSPHLTYGIDFALGYKGFSLSGLIYGTGKRHMQIGVHYRQDQSLYVFDKVQLDYWREDNRNATFPRKSMESRVNGQNNDRTDAAFWLKDASFIRLKNLSLGYDFKYSFLKNTKWLSTCRVNLTGTNLFTISDVKDFFDPETASTQGGYPVQRVYSIGLTVGF